ncbi:MAG: thiamine pyrophosphate-binding protein [Deltaproteobacteria bacterium]|nr:thiamine pyrophosphate-binding protein [Deltaproteobacteria bacterium]
MSGEKKLKYSSDIIIRKAEPSPHDHILLNKTIFDKSQLSNDFFDYSKGVVRKPWGYEYLIYQNDTVAVWILYIQKDYQTSLHAHLSKKTSITVLSGKAVCSTAEGEYLREAGKGMVYGNNVFHRTKSISDNGTFVMEIETPVNKRDLVRAVDDYGREKLGYEGLSNLSINLHNYNYISFIDSNIYYNIKKRFGPSGIELHKIDCLESFTKHTQGDWDLIVLLKGEITDRVGKVLLGVGDSISRKEFLGQKHLIQLREPIEIIIVKKSDLTLRLSDFIVSFLKKRGIKNFFFVVDTINAHLVDAIVRDTDLQSLCCSTENTAMLAGEAYTKLTGKLAVVVVSSGSSAMNTLTGLANTWIDSTPLLIISAQSRSSNLDMPANQKIRQLANKEIDIVNIVRPITKYAKVVSEASCIKEDLEQAITSALEGRQGPAWLDIPIDILGTNIDESELSSLKQNKSAIYKFSNNLQDNIKRILDLLQSSSRPVILAGYGVRAAKAEQELYRLIRSLSVPLLVSRRGIDLVPEDFTNYFGCPGTYGQRSANFIIQNCDLLITIGARLSLPLVGRTYKAFARKAFKILIDIDPDELKKPTVHADLQINADAKEFLNEMGQYLNQLKSFQYDAWISKCQYWKKKYPPHHDYNLATKDYEINPYHFVEALSGLLSKDAIIVVDGGSTLDYVMQAFKVKKGQRIISSPGLEYQGFSIPGALGASLGSGKEIICLCENNGFQKNIDSLKTICELELPVKIFILSSRNSNHNVQQLQSIYFGKRFTGLNYKKGNDLSELLFLNKKRKLVMDSIQKPNQLKSKIKKLLAPDGPAICTVELPDYCETVPRITLTVRQDGRWIAKPLEDMYPFLGQRELKKNMFVNLLEEDMVLE